MPIHHSVFNNPFETKWQEIDWIDGLPYSPSYDDRFFQADAIKEIKDVFITPNNLEDRFKQSQKLSIGELGFGFGLNFFVTAMIWGQSKCQSSTAVLNYVSIEEALPSKEEISKVLKNFPELHEIGKYFLSHYSPIHNDMQRIELPELNIRLTLIQNDAELALQNLLGFSNNLIDAWYLDGFDPAKNQAMWNSSVTQLVALLSSNQATFGTFTSAGFVKRNFTKFGYDVSKVNGFGNKRHKLIGKILPRKHAQNSSSSALSKIAIIGSGIAGSSAAHAAANHGMQVDVFEYGQEAACGTSSNPVAAMYPRFSANNSSYAHLIAQSY
ncbi:tRNA (5-methylaminomethyl-2-thiouridine)(34)-methyltransferase MnmD, partial [Gammaproteobacteria bacterium]|nr:tRNA (5-methylaminomethyl-2-thiouridine)(34)-methyltransferase MnmD [Gammaproteobacteria bacterium]